MSPDWESHPCSLGASNLIVKALKLELFFCYWFATWLHIPSTPKQHGSYGPMIDCFLLCIHLLLLRSSHQWGNTKTLSPWKSDWSLIELLPLFHLLGLVLHEEHIELLSEDFRALKKAVEGKVFQKGTLHFTGDFPQEAISFPVFRLV